MKALNVRGRSIVITAALVALVLLVRDFNSRIADLRRISIVEAKVGAEQTNLVATKVFLETSIAYATSEEAVEEFMYVEAKEKRPGDHPVEVLPGQESEVEETPIAAPARQQVENWQLWLALFYDIKSP